MKQKRIEVSNVPGGRFYSVVVNGKRQPSQWGRSIGDVKYHLRSVFGKKATINVVPRMSE